jgi:hypothetical protein
MPTRIELLKQAGFSDGEIGDWATTERQRMQEAGFTDGEIDDEFGVTRPPKEVPAAFIHRILGAASEYAQAYYGDEPLGFSPEKEADLKSLGVVGNIIIPAGKGVDAMLRTLSAGTAGLGAAVGQAVEEGHDAVFGPSPYGKGKAARDFAQLAQIAALLSTASGRKPGAARAPAPKADAANAPVNALPRAEDFRNAAAAISGTSASFPIEQKLLQLWTDHGIPPAEVAEDARRDRAIGEAIRSDSEKLPDAYVRTAEPRPAAGAEPNVPAPLAESAQADSASVPAERQAAPAEPTDRSSANLNAPEPARMIAQSEDSDLTEPPRKRQRPFAEDYPRYQTDARGRLLRDVEGRPLGAKFVAGRRFSGKADERLSPDDIKNAAGQLNIPIVYVDRGVLEDHVGGQYARPSQTAPLGDISINTRYKPPAQNIFIAHEFGHAIDHITGDLSATLTPDEIFELRDVYSDLRGGSKKGAPRRQPEDYDYDVNDINMELVAEGLRAYMSNPNYLKTVAPKAAAKFRAAVNESPLLKKVIQLNSLGPIGLIGAGILGRDRDDQ